MFDAGPMSTRPRSPDGGSEASDCQRLSLTPSRQSAISGCLKVFVATACRQSLLSGYV